MVKSISLFKNEKKSMSDFGFKLSFRILLKKKAFLVGFIILMVYSIIALLDVAVPQYLGAGYGLVSQLTRFSSVTGSGPLPPTLKPSSLYGNGPAWWYYFGTTYAGIPVLPAILSSLYIDLGYTALVILVSSLSGLLIGTVSGYFGGATDEALMRIMDTFISIPFYVTAIGLAIVFSISLEASGTSFDGLDVVSAALIISLFPIYARISRSATINVKKMRYLDAAKTSGMTHIRNMFSHVLPDALSPVIVQATLNFGTVILFLSLIEYLNIQNVFGISVFLPDLGNLIAQGSLLISLVPGGFSNWWTTVIPVFFLLLIVVGVNIMGDGLRDTLDPERRWK